MPTFVLIVHTSIDDRYKIQNLHVQVVGGRPHPNIAVISVKTLKMRRNLGIKMNVFVDDILYR